MTLRQTVVAARLARESLWRMETEWGLVREQGGSMSSDFWAAFGMAHAAVNLAERAVARAKEQSRLDSDNAIRPKYKP